MAKYLLFTVVYNAILGGKLSINADNLFTTCFQLQNESTPETVSYPTFILSQLLNRPKLVGFEARGSYPTSTRK